MRKIVIYAGEDGYWVVECPSLPGCISQGKTKSEARANIREAIEGYQAALEKIEANPKFVEGTERTDADICARRVFPRNKVKRVVGRKKRKGLGASITQPFL
jgi:predicted RNase H-like HicB family nuclease